MARRYAIRDTYYVAARFLLRANGRAELAFRGCGSFATRQTDWCAARFAALCAGKVVATMGG